MKINTIMKDFSEIFGDPQGAKLPPKRRLVCNVRQAINCRRPILAEIKMIFWILVLTCHVPHRWAWALITSLFYWNYMWAIVDLRAESHRSLFRFNQLFHGDSPALAWKSSGFRSSSVGKITFPLTETRTTMKLFWWWLGWDCPNLKLIYVDLRSASWGAVT